LTAYCRRKVCALPEEAKAETVHPGFTHKVYTMRFFEISCYSDCGSHFSTYLQSVTIMAENEESAILLLKKWFKKTGHSFIYSQEKWNVCDIGEAKQGVISFYENSDY